MRGFRGFESYRLNGLTTVNLIVGKNNSGKTTVLEAVELLASNGHLSAFAGVARRRREMLALRSRYGMDISHLFSGHVCEHGIRLSSARITVRTHRRRFFRSMRSAKTPKAGSRGEVRGNARMT